MRKGLMLLVATAALGTGIAGAAPASAHYDRGDHRGWHHRDGGWNHDRWDRHRERRHWQRERERAHWRHHHGRRYGYDGYYGRGYYG